MCSRLWHKQVILLDCSLSPLLSSPLLPSTLPSTMSFFNQPSQGSSNQPAGSAAPTTSIFGQPAAPGQAGQAGTTGSGLFGNSAFGGASLESLHLVPDPNNPTVKPAGGGIFGGGNASSTPATGGGAFGQTSGASFGSTPSAPGGSAFSALSNNTTPASGGGLFSLTNPTTTPATGGGLFGPNNAAKPPGSTLFGNPAPSTTPAPGTTSTTSAFGGGTPGASIFGTTPSTTQNAGATTGGFGTGGGIFGQKPATPTLSMNAGTPAPTTGSNPLFGGMNNTTAGTSTNPLFGGANNTTAGASTGPLFGGAATTNTASTPAATGPSLFGASTPNPLFGGAKPAGQAGATTTPAAPSSNREFSTDRRGIYAYSYDCLVFGSTAPAPSAGSSAFHKSYTVLAYIVSTHTRNRPIRSPAQTCRPSRRRRRRRYTCYVGYYYGLNSSNGTLYWSLRRRRLAFRCQTYYRYDGASDQGWRLDTSHGRYW